MRVACHAPLPFGVLTAIYEDGVIRRVLFPDESMEAGVVTNDSLPFAVQIAEYLEGKRRSFDLPILVPGTPFRQAVYRATMAIPYGCVATYGDVAWAAGYPLAMRAVGTSMKCNPLPILIPCHRVVHRDRRRAAYGGGLHIKQFLLDLESRFADK